MLLDMKIGVSLSLLSFVWDDGDSGRRFSLYDLSFLSTKWLNSDEIYTLDQFLNSHPIKALLRVRERENKYSYIIIN